MKRSTPLKRGTKPLQRKARLRARTVPKAFRQRRDPAYSNWVRALPCLVGGRWRAKLFAHPTGGFYEHVCSGRVEVCHVRSRGAGGGDRGNVVPMCWGAHEQQHRIGIRSFQTRWVIDLKAEAERLYQQYVQESGIAGSTPAGS